MRALADAGPTPTDGTCRLCCSCNKSRLNLCGGCPRALVHLVLHVCPPRRALPQGQLHLGDIALCNADAGAT